MKKKCCACEKKDGGCRVLCVLFCVIGAVVTAAAVFCGAKKLWALVAPKLKKLAGGCGCADECDCADDCECDDNGGCDCGCSGDAKNAEASGDAKDTVPSSGDAVPDEGPIDNANDIFPNA